jgi:adenylate kinase
MPKVIYLTGAPASGKSSTTRILAERMPALQVWEYGARLTEHVRTRVDGVASQDELRRRSAGIVMPADVDEVDDALIAFVGEHRGRSNVLIDSHPVTKEEYGYRITPFSLARFAQLAPDEIWVLYASPEETRRRIGADAGGRPMVSVEEARTHTALQSSVAATYGMSLGRPVYLFDTAADRAGLVDRLAARLA